MNAHEHALHPHLLHHSLLTSSAGRFFTFHP